MNDQKYQNNSIKAHGIKIVNYTDHTGLHVLRPLLLLGGKTGPIGEPRAVPPFHCLCFTMDVTVTGGATGQHRISSRFYGKLPGWLKQQNIGFVRLPLVLTSK